MNKIWIQRIVVFFFLTTVAALLLVENNYMCVSYSSQHTGGKVLGWTTVLIDRIKHLKLHWQIPVILRGIVNSLICIQKTEHSSIRWSKGYAGCILTCCMLGSSSNVYGWVELSPMLCLWPAILYTRRKLNNISKLFFLVDKVIGHCWIFKSRITKLIHLIKNLSDYFCVLLWFLCTQPSFPKLHHYRKPLQFTALTGNWMFTVVKIVKNTYVKQTLYYAPISRSLGPTTN